MAGLLLGPAYGAAVGVLSPLLSALLTGMPPLTRLPFMVLELLVYGLVSGLCAKKLFIRLAASAANSARGSAITPAFLPPKQRAGSRMP